MSGSSDKTYSRLFEMESFRGRCTGRRSRYTLDGRVFRNLRSFLEAAYDATIEEVMREFYLRQEMSVADLEEHFSGVFGFHISQRTLCHILRKAGIQARGYAERKRLSWKQGKMDSALPKMRQHRKRQYLLGSQAEQTVRYMLRQGLMMIDAQWDAVIGDNLQHILKRYEVDIPLVLIERETNKACRIAIEVDGSIAHSTPRQIERDGRKTRELMNAGWHVLRISSDGLDRREHVVTRMTDLMLKIIQVAEEAFLEKSSQA